MKLFIIPLLALALFACDKSKPLSAIQIDKLYASPGESVKLTFQTSDNKKLDFTLVDARLHSNNNVISVNRIYISKERQISLVDSTEYLIPYVNSLGDSLKAGDYIEFMTYTEDKKSNWNLATCIVNIQ